jgi:ammonium transporter, Amt family
MKRRISFLPLSWRLRRTLGWTAFAFLIAATARRAHAQDASTIQPADPLAARVAMLARSLNYVWALLAGFLVMFMQSGFALIETGMCRAKNAAHTMSMNMMVYALSMAGFFACGFAFMCGGVNGVPGGPGGPSAIGLDHCRALSNMFYITIGGKPWGLLGRSGFFLLGHIQDFPGAMVWFLYMMVFMDTAATIPTGTLAERWRLKSFAAFSVVVGAIIYPVYGCWMWGGGWLSQLGLLSGMGHGAVDFAGSSVVHLQGGIMALALVLQIGPRIGKYDEQGNPRPIFGHHMPMVIFGTLLLAFCWFGFNAGSTLAGVSDRIGVIAVNTMLAGGFGTLSAATYLWYAFGKPDPSLMCNGMLGGLVAITAGCAFVSPPAAALIGVIAGVITVLGVLQLEKRGIDDPVGAIGVHAFSGLWGLIAVGIFADGTFGDGYNGVSGGVTGLLYGHHQFGQLLAQCVAGAVCVGWNFLAAGAAFLMIGRIFRTNRVSPQVEVAGLDVPEMGTPGYPEFVSRMAQEQITSDDIYSARGQSY